jgi:acetyl esterase/lipase
MTVTKEMVQAFLDFIKEDTWAYCGEEEKQYYHIDGLVNVGAALEAALAAIPGPAVKVKRLQWMTMDNGDAWSRPTFIGPIYNATAKGWMHRNGTLNEADGVEAAKAAAQADYEARILSALTPAPDLASENERLRSALEEIANAYSAHGYSDAMDAVQNIKDIAKEAINAKH